MKIIDTLIVKISDTHSGGSTALFPPRTFGDENQNHTPTAKQLRIYDVWKRCYEYVREARRGKRLIVVHNGDAIEGLHHNTIQVSLMAKKTQAAAHIELMDEFLRGMDWDRARGDLLYYTRGTETHVEDIENDIARDLGAEQREEKIFVWDHLTLNVNGRILWYLHHGKRAGDGANEGNALRNSLRDIYWNCLKVGQAPPDVVTTSHVHTPTTCVYSARADEGGEWHEIRGIILPSWQEKTRFAKEKMPVARNEIGGCFLEISAAGSVGKPKFILKETEKSEVILT